MTATQGSVGITVIERRDDIDAAIARVRALQVEIAEATKEAEEKKAVIDAALKATADPLKEELIGIAAGVYGYTIGKEQELIDNPPDGKTATFSSGQLLWRTSPGAIESVGKANNKAVIAEIKELGLEAAFIRTVEEPNRDAMLAAENADALARLKTVKLVKPEIFTIKPTGASGFETKMAALAKILDRFRKNRIKK